MHLFKEILQQEPYHAFFMAFTNKPYELKKKKFMFLYTDIPHLFPNVTEFILRCANHAYDRYSDFAPKDRPKSFKSAFDRGKTGQELACHLGKGFIEDLWSRVKSIIRTDNKRFTKPPPVLDQILRYYSWQNEYRRLDEKLRKLKKK